MDSIKSDRGRPDIETEGNNNGVFLTTSQVLRFSTSPDHGKEPLEIEDIEDAPPEVFQFSEDIQYYLCCCGYFIGFGNFIIFPYLVFQNGGAVFFIPYSVAVLVIVIPAFILETAWGQLVPSKLNHKYSMLHPGCQGIGLAMVVIVSLTLVHYSILFPWSLSFFLESFQNPFPWETSDEDSSLWNNEYFHESVLQRSEGIEAAPRIVPMMLCLLLVSYVLFYFTVLRGLQTSSSVAYFSVPVPCFLTAILLIKGLTLEGSEVGLYYLFIPEWSKILNMKIWERALSQAIFQVGLTYGPILLYGSARKPSSKIIASSIALPLLDYFLSIVGALTVFSFMGHVSEKRGIKIEDISDGGFDLAFIAYPGLLTKLNMPNFWAILFFLMLMFIGIDTIFGQLDFIIAYCWDSFPSLRKKWKKEFVVLCIVALFCLGGIPFVTTSGWYYFQLFNKYVGSFSIVFVLALELYVIGFHLGFEKLDAIMHARTGETLPTVIKICLKFVTLPLMALVVLYGLYTELKSGWESFAQCLVGRILTAAPILAVFVGFIWEQKGPTVDQLVAKQLGSSLDLLVIKLKHQQCLRDLQEREKSDKGIKSPSPKPRAKQEWVPFESANRLASRTLPQMGDSP